MHIQLRVHKWVLWWFYVGIVVGLVALVNILFRNLSRTQDHAILIVGVVNWVLGGIVCWAFDGVRFARPKQTSTHEEPAHIDTQREWHPASDFVFPGGRKRLLPPRR